MISKVSSKIVSVLASRSVINKDDAELYDYGFFILLSQLLYFIIALATGIILKIIPQSVIFYLVFLLIRKYAGGYHASTEARCEIFSTLSIVGSITVAKLSEIYDFKIALLVISAVSAVCIFIFSPLDTPEKPLSQKEFNYFRKISWLILLAIIISITVSYILKLNFITVPCCMSLILESILLSAGEIKKLQDEKKLKAE